MEILILLYPLPYKFCLVNPSFEKPLANYTSKYVVQSGIVCYDFKSRKTPHRKIMGSCENDQTNPIYGATVLHHTLM